MSLSTQLGDPVRVLVTENSDNTTRVGRHASSSSSILRHTLALHRLGRNLRLSHPAPTIGRSTLKGLPVADLLTGRPSTVCFYCHKPGHVMTNYHRRLAKTSEKTSKGVSVQQLSTISRAPVMDSTTELVVKQKKLDPCFEQHSSPVQLVRPDTSVKQVRLLQNAEVQLTL